MLAELLRSDNVSVDFVSYIPSDPKRVRQRGYDHAHFLAKQVAVVLKTPMVNKFVRTAHNQQVGSNRFVRKSQFANSIQYIGSEIAGQAVLLVDDVLSTGTSMEVVAEELKKHGAKRVYGAVVAHNR